MQHIEKFRELKNLAVSLDLSSIAVAVNTTKQAHDIAYDYIANIDSKTEEDAFPVYVHLNLIGRILEQIEGMLICIATKSYTSAEALARVVVESSINLTYMALHGDARTITAFMGKWLDEHTRKLNDWKKEVEDEEYQEQISALIDDRLEALQLYEQYVDLIGNKFKVAPEQYNDLWTNSLFKRFNKLDKAEDYYSIYHRLSGSSHMTAEDTISFMLALQMPDDIRIKMAKEAISYSVMMSRVVCVHFIESLAMCCIYHGMTERLEIEKFLTLKNSLYIAIEQIRIDAGVPAA